MMRTSLLALIVGLAWQGAAVPAEPEFPEAIPGFQIGPVMDRVAVRFLEGLLTAQRCGWNQAQKVLALLDDTGLLDWMRLYSSFPSTHLTVIPDSSRDCSDSIRVREFTRPLGFRRSSPQDDFDD